MEYEDTVIVTVLHHPTRPIGCIRRTLSALDHATSRDLSVIVHIQDSTPQRTRKDFGDVPYDLTILTAEQHPGLSAPLRESLKMVLAGPARWWMKCDDDIVLPPRGIDALISCIEIENEIGEHDIAYAQINGQRLGIGSTCSANPADHVGVLTKFVERPDDMPYLDYEHGSYVRREAGAVSWCVCDFVDIGCTVFDRKFLDIRGIDTIDGAYFVGGISIDLMMQAREQKKKVVFCIKPQMDHRHDDCMTQEYVKAKHNNPAHMRASGKHFMKKWGVESVRLNNVKDR